MSRKKRREREKNAIYSGHLRFCLQPRAAHALHSNQLRLEDCMIDLYDSLPREQQDDQLALIYQASNNNQVAVNTPVGITERVNIQNIVTQGGVFGPLQCSNSIDTIGKKCYQKGEHLYTYKGLVPVMPLSMVDDLLAVAPCNQRSVALNTFINVQIELKKLKFHTPDENGKTKWHVLHIGKENKLCPTLQVHGTRMIHVSEDTYLGDIISSDGRNMLVFRFMLYKRNFKVDYFF